VSSNAAVNWNGGLNLKICLQNTAIHFPVFDLTDVSGPSSVSFCTAMNFACWNLPHLKYHVQFWASHLQEGHWGAGACPNSSEAGEGSREQDLLEAAKGPGFFSVEKRRLRGDRITRCSYLKGGCSEVGVSLLSQVTSNRTRRNRLRLHQQRIRLDIRKNFFTERVVKHWNRLPREVVEAPSLEVFWRHVDVVLRDMV